MLIRTRFAPILVLALGLLVSNANATQIIHRSVEQLGSESTEVVRGKVASIQSYWNADKSKIYTDIIVDVDESYKGASAGSVRLVQLGGVVDNVKMTVHGALQWRTDEEVLLFLEPYKNGAYHVSGFSQGKFKIERDPRSGTPFVKGRDVSDAQLVGAPTGSKREVAEKMTLDSFIDRALGGKGGSR